MFGKNEIDNYMKATEKIKLPTVQGEYRAKVKEEKRRGYVGKFAMVASLTMLFMLGGMMVNLRGDSGLENSNSFSIVAHAADNTEQVLAKGSEVGLFKGKLYNSIYSTNPLKITGDSIKKVNVTSRTGILEDFNEYYIENDEAIIALLDGSKLDNGMVFEPGPTKNSIEIINKDAKKSIGLLWIPNGDYLIDGNKGADLVGQSIETIKVEVTFENGDVQVSNVDVILNEDGTFVAKLS
ncbi:hypothetical protein ACQPU1_04205 [Clostridium paraputrificum]|uniref:hypothetical protein n=1 Tax=Clostridium TaxID=1485 RepID=UPI003D326772